MAQLLLHIPRSVGKKTDKKTMDADINTNVHLSNILLNNHNDHEGHDDERMSPDDEIENLSSRFHQGLSLNDDREKYYQKVVGSECFSTESANEEIRDTINIIEITTGQRMGMRIIDLESSRITRAVAKLARLLGFQVLATTPVTQAPFACGYIAAAATRVLHGRSAKEEWLYDTSFIPDLEVQDIKKRGADALKSLGIVIPQTELLPTNYVLDFILWDDPQWSTFKTLKTTDQTENVSDWFGGLILLRRFFQSSGPLLRYLREIQQEKRLNRPPKTFVIILEPLSTESGCPDGEPHAITIAVGPIHSPQARIVNLHGSVTKHNRRQSSLDSTRARISQIREGIDVNKKGIQRSRPATKVKTFRVTKGTQNKHLPPAEPEYRLPFEGNDESVARRLLAMRGKGRSMGQSMDDFLSRRDYYNMAKNTIEEWEKMKNEGKKVSLIEMLNTASESMPKRSQKLKNRQAMY